MQDTKAYKQLNDEELISRFQKSNENQWLGILLPRYTLLLLGVAMKYLKDKTAAEDAVQFIFLKTLTHLPKGEMPNFKGWLYVLMRNHCLQILRDKNHLTSEDGLQNIPASNEYADEIIWKELSLNQMELAMQELNQEQRQCIQLFYFEDKSYQQIMEITGFSFMQVKSFIQNGKRNLKMIVEKRMKYHHD